MAGQVEKTPASRSAWAAMFHAGKEPNKVTEQEADGLFEAVDTREILIGVNTVFQHDVEVTRALFLSQSLTPYSFFTFLGNTPSLFPNSLLL